MNLRPTPTPTHVPCTVMVGAVGQPRHATDRRAAWVMWNPETRVIELRKTEYNRLQAAQDIMDAELPLGASRKLLTKEEAAF